MGPVLASLIVFLHLRMVGSYRHIQEFLKVWLGLELSTATLNHTVNEMGRAVEPLEEELARDLRAAHQASVGETGWRELCERLWLWVFLTADTCLYQIGYRTGEFVQNLLGESFAGWLTCLPVGR